MSGLKKISTNQIVDPANFFGNRSGGINWANAIDAGGAIMKAVTGKNTARQLADPLAVYSDKTVQFESNIEPLPLTRQERFERRRKKELEASRKQKLKRESKGILTTKIGLGG